VDRINETGFSNLAAREERKGKGNDEVLGMAIYAPREKTLGAHMKKGFWKS
jgi:hypothetical protein